MEFLKRHMFSIICIVVAVGGIGLMITSARAMPRVLEKMRTVESIHRNLDNLQKNPVGRGAIDAERRRIKLVNDDREKVLAKAKELYGYEPLVEGALPEGDALERMKFRRAYIREIDRLLASLNFGGTATSADVAAARERIAEEDAERREIGRASELPDALRLDGPTHTLAGVITGTGVRQEPVPRGHIAAAQRTYGYIVHYRDHKPPDRVSSLDVRSVMKDIDAVDAPDGWEVWHAQLGYWIQKDVIDAIVSLNSAAAEEAKQRGQDAWVGIMPVKELISIRLSEGYIPRDGDLFVGGKPGGYGEALPPGTPETVFTHSGQHSNYEVIQFSLKMIMDQRDIPRFIDRMCKESFHTLLRVSYARVEPNRKMQGKIYGAEPTVNVLFDFETIMLGNVFRCLMPPSICEDYEIPCPTPQECRREEDQG